MSGGERTTVLHTKGLRSLVRFERYRQSDMTFDDVEVTAVWQCSTCTCRTQGGGR